MCFYTNLYKITTQRRSCCFFSHGTTTTIYLLSYLLTSGQIEEEALLAQRDRATRYVSRNLYVSSHHR